MFLKSGDGKIILRDISKKDVNDYIIWNTEIVEWQNWDAPWEEDTLTKVHIEEKYLKILSKSTTLDPKMIRKRFEICINDNDNTHIGWIIFYYIDENFKYIKQKGFCTIGLDIPDPSHRKKGYGTSAIITYINYLKSHNIEEFYIQTWSGNLAMVSLANKLGFVECNRYSNFKVVNNKKYDSITLKLV
ncbi:MAG: GNAT family N-acetyltransferase [Acholeplasmataceae bacterium]|nr:GNAT family N-acetyltransferase [Acholeplasmataceae bacterium]